VVGSDKVTFEELIAGVEVDYQTSGRKSLDKVRFRSKHLAKSFEGRKARDIAAAEVCEFIARRQREGASGKGSASCWREFGAMASGWCWWNARTGWRGDSNSGPADYEYRPGADHRDPPEQNSKEKGWFRLSDGHR
jgi:hypothetical protein